MEIFVKRGAEFPEDTRVAFRLLVETEPQVMKKGLADRIRAAHLLALAFEQDEVVGGGAIKHNPTHQKSVAENAGVELSTEDFLGEVGYLHTAANHRGKGVGRKVLDCLVREAGGRGLFATVQFRNAASRTLLESAGFVKVGSEWQSEQVDDALLLYVKGGTSGQRL